MRQLRSRVSPYRVGDPQAYPRFVPSPGQGAPPIPSRFAVIVVHGMGQQIEFETLDQVERGLRRVDPKLRALPPGSQRVGEVRFVKLGETPLRRVEMELTSPDEAKGEREVHLYEAYWAPLTEGRVTLRDVVRFLGKATRSAFFQQKKAFERWVFGQMVEFAPDTGTVWSLALATLVVFFFLWMNTAVAVCIARSLWKGSWAGPGFWLDLTGLIQWPVWSALLFAGTLWVASAWPQGKKSAIRWGFNLSIYVCLGATVILVAAAAVGSTILFLIGRLPEEAGFLTADLGWLPAWPRSVLIVAIWGVFVGATLQARETLVQYIGDVAAYIFPSSLDRFAVLRREIKDSVRRIARAVYESASASGTSWQYDRVILLGHSLGSVIGYDVLNWLINEDRLENDRHQVLARTCLFLTLGSPLDKTAFIFARQGERTSDAREALAATVQPMIQSYSRRPPRWVNVFSPHDLVSGELDYYDDRRDEAARRRWVKNHADLEASVPLLAHVQYWENAAIFEILRAAIFTG